MTRVSLMSKIIILFLLLLFSSLEAYELSPYYYEETCPLALEIVRQNVEAVVYRDPTMAASLLRLHFHDCFVLGCDGSILLDSVGGIVSEKNAVPNLNSVRGFDVIDHIKYVLEEACPQTVSCADILAIVARDSVHLRGGPSWEVLLGRKDSLKASLSGANTMIPAPNFTLDQLIANFQEHDLDIVDLVSLSGSHTIGRSRCVSFRGRIYGKQPFAEIELEYDYHHRYAVFFRSLRSVCPVSGRDNARIPLDLRTPRFFDNHYYLNLLQGKGLLQSDDVLVTDDLEESVLKLVWAFAFNQELFFEHFAVSMVKMGNINALTGTEGEVRHNCRYVNAYYGSHA